MGRPYYDSSGPWYKATIDFSTFPIGAVEISLKDLPELAHGFESKAEF
jgi:hypothetical protein